MQMPRKSEDNSKLLPKIGRSAHRSQRPRFNADMLEIFLLLIILSLVMYPYIQDISLFDFLTPTNPSEKPGEIDFYESVIQERTPEHRIQMTMQVVLGRGEDDIDMVLLDTFESTQLVLPNKLPRVRNGPVISNDYQGNRTVVVNQVQESQSQDIKANQSMRIKCTAPFPIQIAYEGNGIPTFGKIIVTKRNLIVVTNYTQDFYIATLDFEKTLLDETDTGRYICHSIGEHSPQSSAISHALKIRNEDEKLTRRIAIKIFVPGRMHLLNRNFFHHGYYSEESSLDNTGEIRIEHQVEIDGEEQIRIPCSPSDPKLQVHLYRKEKENRLYPLGTEKDGNNGIVYDNVDGFQVPIIAIMSDWTDINIICRIQLANGVRDISFQINLKGLQYQVAPVSSIVTIHPSKLPIQMFKCEGEEPLVINWLSNLTSPVSHEETRKNGKKYITTFIGTPMHFSGGASAAKFQCKRKRDGKIIHTWDWVKEESGLKLSFNQTRNEWSCCSKNFESLLFMEACSSMLECKLKASLLLQQQSFDFKSTPEAEKRNSQTGGQVLGNISKQENGCTMWPSLRGVQAGFIMCAYSQPRFKVPPMFKFFTSWENETVVFRDQVESKLVKMRATTRPTTLEEDMVGESDSDRIHGRIECISSSMLFAKGFRWKIFTDDQENQTFENVQFQLNWDRPFANIRVISYREEYQRQSVSYLGILDISIEKHHKRPLLMIAPQDNGGSANLTMKSAEVIKISCEAPLWNDTDAWIASFMNKSLLPQ